MSYKSSFLPTNPKIIKRINSSRNSNTSMSSLSNSFYDNASQQILDQNTQQQLMQKILRNQHKKIDQVKQKISKMKQNNDALQQSLKYFDVHKEQRFIQAQIQKAREEQAQIIFKIDNCQKVQKSTTAQEYYLWQKKKKTDQFNAKIQQIHAEQKQERQRLKSICISYGKLLDQTKYQIQHIVAQITKLRNGQTSSQFSLSSQVDPSQIQLLKEEHDKIDSTVRLMKQTNAISRQQLKDTIQNTQNQLNKAFSNYKSSLIKDLMRTKKQIEQAPAQPPILDQNVSLQKIIEEYENKMGEIKKQVGGQLVSENSCILDAYDWKSLDWKTYLGKQNKEALSYYDTYQQYEKELDQTDQQLKQYEQQFRILISQIIESKQRNTQIQLKMNQAYRQTISK